MPGLVIGRRIPGRRERHRRIHERVPELLRDPLRRVVSDEEMFAEREARSILLDTAGVINGGRFTRGNRVADLGPCEVLDQERLWLRVRRRREGEEGESGDELLHEREL